jgi:outer membrane protein assembly factor BamB
VRRGLVEQRVVAVLAVGALGLASGACDGPPSDDRAPVVWSVARWVKTDRMVLTDSSVIVGTRDSGRVVSLDRSEGRVLWSRKLDDTFVERDLAQYENLVFAAPFFLFGVDKSNGAVRWTYQPPGGNPARYPAVSDAALFVPSQYGDVTRLDPLTGAVIWRTELGETAFPATVASGLVLLGTRNLEGTTTIAGRVVALSEASGQVVWERLVADSAGFPGSGGVVAPPLVMDTVVIVGTYSSRALGLRLWDGALLWERGGGSPLTAQYALGAVPFAGLAVFLRSDGVVEAIDPSSGNLVWSHPSEGGSELASPCAAGNRLYVIKQGNIFVFGPSGEVLWRYGSRTGTDGLPIFSSGPTVGADGTIYAGWTETGGEARFGAIRSPLGPQGSQCCPATSCTAP